MIPRKQFLLLSIAMLSSTVSLVYVFSTSREHPAQDPAYSKRLQDAIAGILKSDLTKSFLLRQLVAIESTETPTTTTTLPPVNNCTAKTPTEECYLQTARVISPHEFQLKANNPTLCGSSNVRLLILILSRVDDFEQRLTQRETWASAGRDPAQPVRIAFLLGNTSNEALQRRVTAESLQHNDILQETFDDTYHNLTLKTVMLFKWAATYCPEAQWIMKTDTDVFVNVPRLLQFLEGHVSSGKSQLNTLIGRIAHGGGPIRSKDSKWYASEASYPMNSYPSFAFGPCYVTTRGLPALLYDMSEKTPFFHLEDVFVGILMKKLGGTYLHDEGFCNFHIPDTACSYRNVFCAHDVSQAGMRKVWAEMKNSNLTCG